MVSSRSGNKLRQSHIEDDPDQLLLLDGQKVKSVPTEKDIQARILRYLRSLKLSWWIKPYHAHHAEAGIPDILGTYNGISWFFEVKRPGNKETKLQREQMIQLLGAGAQGGVVTSVVEVQQLIEEEVARRDSYGS